MVMGMKPPNIALMGLEEGRIIFNTSIEIQLVESLFSLSDKCSSGDFLESEKALLWQAEEKLHKEKRLLQREAKKLADENKILAVQLKAAMKVYDSSLVLTSMLNFHCW
jgi:hypothetical protein